MVEMMVQMLLLVNILAATVLPANPFYWKSLGKNCFPDTTTYTTTIVIIFICSLIKSNNSCHITQMDHMIPRLCNGSTNSNLSEDTSIFSALTVNTSAFQPSASNLDVQTHSITDTDTTTLTITS